MSETQCSADSELMPSRALSPLRYELDLQMSDSPIESRYSYSDMCNVSKELDRITIDLRNKRNVAETIDTYVLRMAPIFKYDVALIWRVFVRYWNILAREYTLQDVSHECVGPNTCDISLRDDAKSPQINSCIASILNIFARIIVIMSYGAQFGQIGTPFHRQALITWISGIQSKIDKTVARREYESIDMMRRFFVAHLSHQ